jgi:hypothetical protein
VRIGVHVPNFGPGAGPGVLRGWAPTVECLGFAWQMLAAVAARRDLRPHQMELEER